MTSSIINFLVERYLANIIEIDAKQTEASIFSGTVEMHNLKIKPEIFQSLNLPYLELVNGYVGTIKLEMSMPRFYLYPIKVYINKVFFHARQKNISALKLKDEIEGMESYKRSKLLNVEELNSQINQLLSSEDPGMVKQIINNLQIDVEEIVFRFDDDISYPKIPYSLGIILKQILIKTTTDKYEENSKADQISFAEINHKLIKVKDCCIFMDCYKENEAIDYISQIDPNVKNKIDRGLVNYLGKIHDFYSYCMSELDTHVKSLTSHQYLLYLLNLSFKIAVNENVKNGKPKLVFELLFPNINMSLCLKQIETLLKVVAYINLGALYRIGIGKDYYTKNLTEKETDTYINAYIKYYISKYKKKNAKEAFPPMLTQLESGLTYEQIQTMREAGMVKIDYMMQIEEIDKKIYENQGGWFTSGNKAAVVEYEKKKAELVSKENDLNRLMQAKLTSQKLLEVDEYFDLSDDFLLYQFKFSIKEMIFTLKETIGVLLADFIFNDFSTIGRLFKKGHYFFVSLGNLTVNQLKIKSKLYPHLISTAPSVNNNQSSVLSIEYENNPKFINTSNRLKMRTEKRIYVVFNLYIVQYITNKMVNALNSSINFDEIQSYAKDEVTKYIKAGYVDKFLAGEYQHLNIDLDLKLFSPIVLMPQNIHDDANRKCLYMSLGEFTMTSKLPPRQDPNLDYSKVTDPSIMFDRYILGLIGIELATIDSFSLDNIASVAKNDMLQDSHIDSELDLLVETKNPSFDNLIITLNVSSIELRIDEQQLVFFTTYLGYMTKDNLMIAKEFAQSTETAATELERLKSYAENKGDITLKEELKIKEESIKEKEFGYDPKSKSKNIKNKIRFEYNLSKVTIHLLKTATKEEMKYKTELDKKFLQFVLNTFYVQILLPENSDMIIKMKIVNIFLFDFDHIISPQGEEVPYINEHYQCCISSLNTENSKNRLKQCIMESILIRQINEEELSFIDLLYYYNKMKNKTTINMSLNKLYLWVNLGSMVRINQYMMYYVDMLNRKNIEAVRSVYQEGYVKAKMMNNKFRDLAQTYKFNANDNEQHRDDNQMKESHNNEINPKFFSIVKDKINKRYERKGLTMFDWRNNDEDKQHDKKKEEMAKKKKEEEMMRRRGKTVLEKGRLSFSFEMNEIELKIPIEPKKDNTLMLTFEFNLSFKHNTEHEIEKIVSHRTNRVTNQTYLKNNSNMSIMLSNVDFDIIQFKFGNKIEKPFNERLLSNFRMTMLMNSFLIVKGETYVTNIELNIEPLMMYFGFREIKLFQKYDEIYSEFNTGLNSKYVADYQIDPDDELSIENSQLKRMKRLMEYKMTFENKATFVRNETKVATTSNITTYNNYMNFKMKLDKATIKLFDNTTFDKRVLLEIALSKIGINYISNSDPIDSNNMGNALVEMISGREVLLKDYHINTLHQFADIAMELSFNYYNIRLNEWESFIEPWSVSILMSQVAKMTRLRMDIMMSMFNINLSSNSTQVFNLVLKKYNEDESKWVKSTFGMGLNQKTSTDKIQKEEIALEFSNYTGMPITYWFDSNPTSKIVIESGDLQSYTRNKLFELQGANSDKNLIQKNKFSFSISGYRPIESQDSSSNHFETFILVQSSNFGNQPKGIVSLKVKSSSITKTVTFDSAIILINNTIHKSISISCEDEVLIFGNKIRIRIPLNWLLNDKSVYIQFDSKDEKHLLYSSISPFSIAEEVKDSKCSNKVKEIKDKLISSSEIVCKDDRYSKALTLYDNSNNKTINVAFDCIGLISHQTALASSSSSSSSSSQVGNPIIDNKTIALKKKKRLVYDYQSVEYCIIINPGISFDNRIPFDLTYHYSYNSNPTEINNKSSTVSSSSSSHVLKPLEKYVDYTIKHNDTEAQFQISLNYNNEEYTSESISFNNIANMIKLFNKDKEKAIECNFLIEEIRPFGKFKAKTLKIHSKSISSKNYILYFDYIITNRLDTHLYLQDGDKSNKKKDKETAIINPQSINLLTTKLTKMVMKSKDSLWSKPFDIKTKGLDGVVSLEKNIPHIESSDPKSKKKMIKSTPTTDVAVIISSSVNFTHSTMIIFEPRYILINNLGFEIVYKQEDLDTIYVLKDQQKEQLVYNTKKKVYRLGIEDSWSGLFNIENVEDYDLKIEVGKDKVVKYSQDQHCFSYDNKTSYILIRIVIQTYDNGLIYIMFTNPKYPYMQIKNLANEDITIIENKTCSHSIKQGKVVPFVWSNTLSPSNELKCCLSKSNAEINFSFSSFDKIIYDPNKSKVSKGKKDKKDKKIEKNANNQPKYQLTITPENDTNTRTLIIEEISIHTQSLSTVQNIALGRKLPKITKYNISLQGFGISIIDDRPKEMFYISFYGIDMKYSNNFLKNDDIIENTVNILVYMKNFQIDYCLNDSFKNIIFPKTQIVPSNEEILYKKTYSEEVYPFFQLLICQQYTTNTLSDETIVKFPQIDCTIQEFNIKIEQYAILNLINVLNELFDEFDFYKGDDSKPVDKSSNPLENESSLKIHIDTPIDLLSQENENKNMMCVNYLLLSALKINVTLRVDLGNLDIASIPTFVMKIIGAFGNSLARITDSPLRFTEMLYENVFTDLNRITTLLIQHYKKQGIRQIYKLLGSSDLLGNPIKLVSNIGTGFIELINEPRKGFLRGPSQFGKGLAKGVTSLVGNIVGGGFEMIGTLSGTLLTATRKLRGEKEDWNIEDKEPDNLIEGMIEGLKGGFIELGKGFSGIFLNPYRNGQTEGVKGVFKGIGTGLLGALLAPFSALLKLINAISIGMKNTATTFTRSRIKTVRFRYPRVIVEDEPIQIYDQSRAEAHEMLLTLVNDSHEHKILFCSDFQCEEKKYREKPSTIILSDRILIVVYEAKRIIFKLKLKKVAKCEVHTLNQKFAIVFHLITEKKKAIRLNDQIICFQIYEIMKHLTIREAESPL